MPTLTEQHRTAIAAVFAGIAGVVCFLSALNNDWVNYDDWNYIFDIRTQRGLSWSTFCMAFTEVINVNYHPLTWLSYLFDVSVAGENPRWFHGVNIAFHGINSALVVIYLSRNSQSQSIFPAFLSGLLWSVHPLRVESVAWVSERKDVLFTCFFLLSLLAFTNPRGRNGKAAFVFATLSLLSKPMAVSLPVVMWLHLVLLERTKIIAATREVLPYVFLAVAMAVATWLAQAGGMQTTALFPPLLRLQTTLVSTSRYVVDSVNPDCLHAPYLYPDAWSMAQIASAAVVVTTLCALALLSLRRSPRTTFGIAWFFVTLVPVSGLVMVGIAPNADRYTYVTVIGLHLALLPLLEAMHRRAAISMVGVGVVVASLAALSQPQIETWRSTEDLVAHAMFCNPDNPPVLEAAASIAAEHGNFDTARTLREHASELRPGYVDVWVGLAGLATNRGDAAEAKRLWLEVLSWDHTQVLGHHGLALALFELGEFPASESELSLALAGPAPIHPLLPLIRDRWRNLKAERQASLVEQQIQKTDAAFPMIRRPTRSPQ